MDFISVGRVDRLVFTDDALNMAIHTNVMRYVRSLKTGENPARTEPCEQQDRPEERLLPDGHPADVVLKLVGRCCLAEHDDQGRATGVHSRQDEQKN